MKKWTISVCTVCVALLILLGIPNVLPAKAAEGESVTNAKEVVTYGSYHNVALKWEVVAKEGTKAVLFLKDVLRDGTTNADNMLLMQFNEKDVGNGSAGQNEWLTSPIKTFLNGDFYNAAFSAEQKEAIVDVDYSYPGYSNINSTRQNETVENPYAAIPGSPCKVFLPTYGDIASWYNNLEERALGNTAVWWWTRSPVYVVEGSVNPSNGGERQLVWYAHEGGENRAPVTYYLALRPVIVVDTAKFVAEVTTSRISGTVTAGAKVVLYQGNNKMAETTADENGKYTFSSVQAGDYVLEVSLNGYTTQRVNVTVGSENVVQDVELTAINDGKQPTQEEPQKTGLSGGAIAAIVTACVVAVAAVAIGVFFLLKKKKA